MGGWLCGWVGTHTQKVWQGGAARWVGGHVQQVWQNKCGMRSAWPNDFVAQAADLELPRMPHVLAAWMSANAIGATRPHLGAAFATDTPRTAPRYPLHPLPARPGCTTHTAFASLPCRPGSAVLPCSAAAAGSGSTGSLEARALPAAPRAVQHCCTALLECCQPNPA